MTDSNRDWVREAIEEVKKGLVPDKAVLPPINIPQDTSSSSGPSSTSNNSTSTTSHTDNSSTEKK